jgi:hypothetical protein
VPLWACRARPGEVDHDDQLHARAWVRACVQRCLVCVRVCGHGAAREACSLRAPPESTQHHAVAHERASKRTRTWGR